MAYGEQLFGFHSQKKQFVSIIADSLGNWFGYDSIVESKELASDIFSHRAPADQQLQQDDQIEDELLGSDVGADDLEEKKLVLFYFRLDEGQGTTITDISDNKYTCKLSSEDAWSKDTLGEGNPLDYDDKWGKHNSPSFSISVMDELKIEQPLQVGKVFTFEFWIKFDEDATIEIMGSCLLSFENNQMSFMGKQIKDWNQAGQWNHFAIVVTPKELIVLVNSKL